jgi:hypothetical protein
MHRHVTRFVCCLGLLGASACADGASGPSAPDSGLAGGRLLPFETGFSWTYRVTGDGESFTKVTTVGAPEPVGIGPHASTLAYKVVTMKGDDDQTISWQSVEGERVVRYREQAFHAATGQLEAEEWWSPAKLHVDGSAAHTTPGARWLEEYRETKQNAGELAQTETERDPWTVDGVDQSVTVPAGTFRAIVLTKSGGSAQKTYWYVPGVGKVKETGGQTEELVSYEVSP